GDILWDGRFNDLTSSEDLTKWSFSNEVGPYQYYIHGDGNVTEYVNLNRDFKNPADEASSKGVKITIDQTSHWEGQDMLRTELIPQTTAAINKGKVYYHFSMKRTDTNAPSVDMEHQVNFFESHFTEMKYGWINGEQGTDNPNLQWMVTSQSQWKTPFTAGQWYNFAYEIDFDGQTVGLWGSNGSDSLSQIVVPVSASASSNGADWHLGVLRLPRTGYTDSPTEDWYFSGVYIESGELTKSVTGP
ncbi:hypothetical protein NA57DRAFT_17427, partial [Rhizodiscina lignyota]